MPNAYVRLHRTGAREIHIRPDSDGKYEVALPVGFYDGFIAADDYFPACGRVHIDLHEMTSLMRHSR